METNRSIAFDFNSLLRVVCISELSERIFGLLDVKDLARLAILSRSLFECAMPKVWEEVNVGPLITLVPKVEIIDDKANSAYDFILSVPGKPDLSRFNVYAPHVKHLRGTPEYTIMFSISDTSALGPVLLPNLQHITLVSQRNYQRNDLRMIHILINLHWVYRFLCPSLVSFRMFGVDVHQPPSDWSNQYLPWIDRLACLRLVGEMSDRCPRIETLQMFPDNWRNDFCDDYCELAKMSCLRSFTWSGHGVSGELMEALGMLPHLESLCFMSNITGKSGYYSDLSDSEGEYNPDDDVASDSITITEKSFPELRSLEIRRLGPRTIAKLCGLSPLFRGLTRLVVIYGSSSSSYWCNTRAWSDDVFAYLGHGSPHLTDLEISHMPESLVLTGVIDQLKQMPLQRLSLTYVSISNEVECRQFAEAVPNLEDLEIRTGLKRSWLRIFASRLLSLRHFCTSSLNFRTKVDQTEATVNWGEQPGLCHQAITIRTNFQLTYPMEYQVDEVARYIYEIWPNARCDKHSARSDSVNLVVKLLNARLDTLRSAQD
ncbi:hypothetical protein FRC12_005334 [Ceratobasidium sp. 428]|nr:hypothetical protein FRC12_005334 [Ceratobasidium sp. 428]